MCLSPLIGDSHSSGFPHMSVPVVTIPEQAWDAASTYGVLPKGRSRLVVYLTRLLRGSGLAVALIYVLGFFVIRPLLDTTAHRRLEVLEKYRHSLISLYLKTITRVSHIPIVSFDRKNGKRYADAVVQTTDSWLERVNKKLPDDATDDLELDRADKLRQNSLVERLTKLSDRLAQCRGYSVQEIPHYKLALMSIKNFQNKADLEYFNSSEFFSYKLADTGDSERTRTRDIATETKNEIRGIKGLFMLGQV